MLYYVRYVAGRVWHIVHDEETECPDGCVALCGAKPGLTELGGYIVQKRWDAVEDLFPGRLPGKVCKLCVKKQTER